MSTTNITGGDVQAAIEAGALLADPTVLEPGKAYAFIVPGADESVVVVDRTDDKYLDAPRRKAGTVEVLDADAFVAYLAKHGIAGQTEVWSDLERQQLTAVLDAHSDTAASWEGHRLKLVLRRTPAWMAWTHRDSHWMAQRDFAEHIEANAPDVKRPSSADMLELAESFQAKLNTLFESTEVLAGGKRALVFKETTEAKAGHRGQLEIPKDIELTLRPFYGGPVYAVTARFRYRINSGQLSMSYQLDRPSDVLEAAYVDLTKSIGEQIDFTVWAGRA